MLQGALRLDEKYDVYLGNSVSGSVKVEKQGLYYKFICKCSLSGDVICRLVVTGRDKQENLGVLIPMGDWFGLETRIPIKRIGDGPYHFSLLTKQETATHYIPLSPEEPFKYIARLKESFLLAQNGRMGIILPD